MKNLLVISSLFLSCIFWLGCQGTGILMMPSPDDKTNEKYRRSPAYMSGKWNGKYGKSQVEIDASMSSPEAEAIDLKIWITDKEKKQAMIPVKSVILAVGKNKYALFVADTGKLIKQGNYSPMSGGLLYPVMKLFKVQAAGDTLKVQEVIFTKKEGKDKVVKLDPAMKMWGSNTNTIYGSSTEIIGFLQEDKYRLSKEIIFKKAQQKK